MTVQEQQPASVCCPECDSDVVVKDGVRYIGDVSVQRYLCKRCFFRFSDPTKQIELSSIRLSTESSSRRSLLINRSRVGVSTEAKNLTETVCEAGVCDAGGLHDKNQRMVEEFTQLQKLANLRPSTITNRKRALKRLSEFGVDLTSTDSVKAVITGQPFTDSVKLELQRCYDAFCKSNNLAWLKPKMHYTRPEPYVPLECDVDLLIAGCGRRTATFLQVLKDTGARVSEACLLQEKNVDFERREITIAIPSKGSNSRTIRVSEKCIAMLKNLPKKYAPYYFSQNTGALRDSFFRSRRKLAIKLNNGNLTKIHFHSLRHYRGAKEQRDFHEDSRTQYILGHKNPQNTQIYKHYEHHSDSDQFIVKRPQNKKEEDELLEQNFQYVRFDEQDGHPIYRKRVV